ncbi:MAG: hypothetical protein JXB39_08825 [Deltaproteobacteria bacterium]|nr:hypothetical protein [Deltaproteobacteria bacterium]
MAKREIQGLRRYGIRMVLTHRVREALPKGFGPLAVLAWVYDGAHDST